MATNEDLDILARNSTDTRAKLQAIDRVAASDDPRVLQVLLTLAQDTTLAIDVAKAVGAAVARIFWRQERVLDAPLHLFTGPVDEAFDKTIGDIQRGAVGG